MWLWEPNKWFLPFFVNWPVHLAVVTCTLSLYIFPAAVHISHKVKAGKWWLYFHYFCPLTYHVCLIQDNMFTCYLFSLRYNFFKKEGKFFHFTFYLLVFGITCFHSTNITKKNLILILLLLCLMWWVRLCIVSYYNIVLSSKISVIESDIVLHK